MAIEKLQEAVATPEVGLFVVLGQYPLGFILSLVALVSLCAFFVTSANSGVYVLSMLSTDVQSILQMAERFSGELSSQLWRSDF